MVKGGEEGNRGQGGFSPTLPQPSKTALQANIYRARRLGYKTFLTQKGDSAMVPFPVNSCVGWVLGSMENLESGKKERGSKETPPLRLSRVSGGLVGVFPTLRANWAVREPVRQHAQVCQAWGSCPAPRLARPGGQSSCCSPRRKAVAGADVPDGLGSWL